VNALDASSALSPAAQADSNQLRCLWVTRLVPYPPFVGGDATYSVRMIQSLSAAGADVTVLCHEQGGPSPPRSTGVEWVTVPLRDLAPAKSLFGLRPSIVYRFSTPQIRTALRVLLRDRSWDALLIDNVAMAGTLEPRDQFVRDGRPWIIVYVSHNHEASVRRQLAASAPRGSPRRVALLWDAAKASRVERRLVEMADLVTVNTEHDAELYRRQASDQRFVVLTPGYDGPRLPRRVLDEMTPRRITVLGSYGWVAKQRNLWRFLDAAAEPLRQVGIGIDVVGSGPDRFTERLRLAFPNVAVTGTVDHVQPYLAKSRMGVVAEEIGGGFKHKVLSYVFNRVPVACLTGSVEGAPLVPGESILEFADLASLVEGVIRSIDNFALLNDLQRAAYMACADHFEWADRGRVLAETLRGLRDSRS
jgi:glycosyltransferase involved in cell wall biosynthesis